MQYHVQNLCKDFARYACYYQSTMYLFGNNQQSNLYDELNRKAKRNTQMKLCLVPRELFMQIHFTKFNLEFKELIAF